MSKISVRRTLFIVAIAGFALSAALILLLIQKSPRHVVPMSQPTLLHKQIVNYDVPTRLDIPKLDIDAAIEYVGITSTGELGVPAGPANAGWYYQGARPGETGSAVIDGHFGYKNHIPAVFDNLHTLQKGDKLYVRDIKGITATFIVRELRTYKQADYAPAVFRSNDSKAHLNLITCEGTWNPSQKSFSNRLVVFTDKQE